MKLAHRINPVVGEETKGATLASQQGFYLLIEYTFRSIRSIRGNTLCFSFLYNDNAAKLFELCGIVISGGAGGIRTHVQTGKPYAFYTFIPAFGFRATARPGPPTGALASKFSSCRRGPTRLFPIYLHRLILRFGTTSLERCLVPSSDDGIKPVIYCTSIRQRERNCFRQLNFCSLRLKS